MCLFLISLYHDCLVEAMDPTTMAAFTLKVQERLGGGENLRFIKGKCATWWERPPWLFFRNISETFSCWCSCCCGWSNWLHCNVCSSESCCCSCCVWLLLLLSVRLVSKACAVAAKTNRTIPAAIGTAAGMDFFLLLQPRRIADRRGSLHSMGFAAGERSFWSHFLCLFKWRHVHPARNGRDGLYVSVWKDIKESGQRDTWGAARSLLLSTFHCPKRCFKEQKVV